MDGKSTDGTPHRDLIDLDAERQARRPPDASETDADDRERDAADPALEALARLVRALDAGPGGPSTPNDAE